MNNKDFKAEFNNRLIEFSLKIIALCRELRKDSNLWPISDQLIRSATSIGANIIEARACGTKKDYINFFQIALKSSNETEYWLILIEKSKPDIQITDLLKENREISSILAAGLITMKNKNRF